MTEPTVVSAFERFKARVVGVLPAPTARCWLFHKWGPWMQGASHPIMGAYGITGLFLIQAKTCSRCRKMKMSSVKCKL